MTGTWKTKLSYAEHILIMSKRKAAIWIWNATFGVTILLLYGWYFNLLVTFPPKSCPTFLISLAAVVDAVIHFYFNCYIKKKDFRFRWRSLKLAAKKFTNTISTKAALATIHTHIVFKRIRCSTRNIKSSLFLSSLDCFYNFVNILFLFSKRVVYIFKGWGKIRRLQTLVTLLNPINKLKVLCFCILRYFLLTCKSHVKLF